MAKKKSESVKISENLTGERCKIVLYQNGKQYTDKSIVFNLPEEEKENLIISVVYDLHPPFLLVVEKKEEDKICEDFKPSYYKLVVEKEPYTFIRYGAMFKYLPLSVFLSICRPGDDKITITLTREDIDKDTYFQICKCYVKQELDKLLDFNKTIEIDDKNKETQIIKHNNINTENIVVYTKIEESDKEVFGYRDKSCSIYKNYTIIQAKKEKCLFLVLKNSKKLEDKAKEMKKINFGKDKIFRTFVLRPKNTNYI